MAAVDVVMPAPPPPPPAPVVRISRLALAAADAVVCLWIASLWVLLASVAAALIGDLACGSGCTGAAWRAAFVSVLFVAVVCPVAWMLLSKFVVPFYCNQLEKGAAALEPLSDAVRNAHLIAAMAFPCLEAFGALLKLLAWASEDSATDRISSVIMEVSLLGISVMCCFVFIPGLAVMLWRMRRHGSSASVVPI